MMVPRERAEGVLGFAPPAGEADVPLSVTLDRVSPRGHDSMRTLDFTVAADGGGSARQRLQLKDAPTDAAFSGPMADAADRAQLGSPMPGVVEKVHVKAGQAVKEGDTLMTVSAMKMEVHVKALYDGDIGAMHVAAGDKVIEGALLAKLVAK
jgi:biotin carboxyl carrier protein